MEEIRLKNIKEIHSHREVNSPTLKQVWVTRSNEIISVKRGLVGGEEFALKTRFKRELESGGFDSLTDYFKFHNIPMRPEGYFVEFFDSILEFLKHQKTLRNYGVRISDKSPLLIDGTPLEFDVFDKATNDMLLGIKITIPDDMKISGLIVSER